MKNKPYGMRGQMNPQTAQKKDMMNGLDKPAKAEEKYKGDAHPMSPITKKPHECVWDKRSK